MTKAKLQRVLEVTYYSLILVTIILCIVVVAMSVLPGITRDKYVTGALSLSLLVTLVCIIFWVGHHLEIKVLGSTLSKLIWTGLIAGLIAPIPSVIVAPPEGSIEIDEAITFDPSSVEYLPEHEGRPYFQTVTPILSNKLTFSEEQPFAIPILFTVKDFATDLDGKPNIALSVIVKNKTTHYALAEDFPDPLTDFKIAGDAFMSEDTMKEMREKYDLADDAVGVFLILDQLLPEVDSPGELLIRVTATDTLTNQSVYFDKTVTLARSS